jgi:hypothetical protein
VNVTAPAPPGSCHVTAVTPADVADGSNPSNGTSKALPHGTTSSVPSSTMTCPEGPDDLAVTTTSDQPMYRAVPSSVTCAVQSPPVVMSDVTLTKAWCTCHAPIVCVPTSVDVCGNGFPPGPVSVIGASSSGPSQDQ